MKLKDFLKDRWPSVAAAALVAAFSAALLTGLGAGGYAAGYVAALFLLCEAAALAAEYFRRRSFYRALLESLERLDKKYLIAEMLPEPSCEEERILCGTLREASKSMSDRVSGVRREMREYREYVEAWVHEIKTPISACRLIMDNRPGLIPRDLLRNFSRIENYVEQALFYARSGSAEKDYVLRSYTLKELAASALKKSAGLLIESGVRVEAEVPEIPVVADPKWMDFILGQILANSVKYCCRRPVLRLSGKRGAHSATLTVEDNGIGIPREDLGRVFDKGFTGKNGRLVAHATGLGLYLCKKLCDKLGLGLSVLSVEGAGTAVSIVFPMGDLHDPAAGASLTKT